jgi:hypothetical protein
MASSPALSNKESSASDQPIVACPPIHCAAGLLMATTIIGLEFKGAYSVV